jgi:hypothetical protein
LQRISTQVQGESIMTPLEDVVYHAKDEQSREARSTR